MNKTCLLAAASALALAAQGSFAGEPAMPDFPGRLGSGTMPKAAKFLYDQNGKGDGDAVGSQNFTSTSPSPPDAAADDFVVPKSTRWKITEIDVSGFYYNGPGPARSENVIFYRNNHGVPGSAVKKGVFTDLAGDDENGNFAIRLPGRGISLKPGTYWVSVVANCSYKGGCGEWAWELSRGTHGNQPMWERPGASGGCTAWASIESCFGYPGDLEFALRGKSKSD